MKICSNYEIELSKVKNDKRFKGASGKKLMTEAARRACRKGPDHVTIRKLKRWVDLFAIKGITSFRDIKGVQLRKLLPESGIHICICA